MFEYRRDPLYGKRPCLHFSIPDIPTELLLDSDGHFVLLSLSKRSPSNQESLYPPLHSK